MARGTRTLAATAAALLLAAVTAPAHSAAAASGRWYRPVVEDGKAFPVLLSADRKWLNWRDTYGDPRMRLVGGQWKQVGVHQGIDIYAEQGAPVVSVSGGTVEKVGWTFYSGRRVGIRDPDDRYWFYAHLSKIHPGVAKGVAVSPGTVLGALGSSGYGPEATEDEFAPHLHLGLQDGKRWRNPEQLLRHLYAASVRTLRSHRAEIASLDRRLNLLSSRSYAPAAPNQARLKALTEILQRRRAQIQNDLVIMEPGNI